MAPKTKNHQLLWIEGPGKFFFFAAELIARLPSPCNNHTPDQADRELVAIPSSVFLFNRLVACSTCATKQAQKLNDNTWEICRVASRVLLATVQQAVTRGPAPWRLALDREQESQKRERGKPAYSPWFPRTAEAGSCICFEPKPDPDPNLSWDGHFVLEKDGKVIRYPYSSVTSVRACSSPNAWTEGVVMENPEKEPLRPSMDEGGEYVEFLWFPKDGEPEHQRIRRDVLAQARKERPESQPHVRFRAVGVRGREFGFVFPDYPELQPVWLGLKASRSRNQRWSSHGR